jgi:ABC-type glycerol-3-phosphate transport system permease component
MQQFFSATGSADWTQVMAASVMFSIPMVLVLTFAQKAFVRGVVSTGIK